MKPRAIVVSLAVLALAGCSATPAVDRDEAGFVDVVRGLAFDSAELNDDETIIEHGDAVCGMARESEQKLDSSSAYLDTLLTNQNATAAQRDYWAAVVASAGTFLCQDVA